jgi:hypothetical protein
MGTEKSVAQNLSKCSRDLAETAAVLADTANRIRVSNQESASVLSSHSAEVAAMAERVARAAPPPAPA